MAAKKQWVWAPKKPAKPKVPAPTKILVQTRADALAESFFVPRFVKSAPDAASFNFVSDIYARWRTSFFTFGAVWSRVDEATGVVAPVFEAPFARLEYTGEDHYSLAYMRHTGKFWEIYQDLSLDEAFDTIREQMHFWPTV